MSALDSYIQEDMEEALKHGYKITEQNDKYIISHYDLFEKKEMVIGIVDKDASIENYDYLWENYSDNQHFEFNDTNQNALSEFKHEYIAAKKRKEMFDALGVKQRAKGLVIYKNGQYLKE